MLILPTGQIFFSDFSKDIEIYTPNDRMYNNRWAPGNITVKGNTVSGIQLNGLSQGSAYGDDYQSATNYPLVRLTPISCSTCGPQPVYYCRTYGHSSMGVATGDLMVSTNIDCSGIPKDFYGLEVVTNGISSGSVYVSK